MSTIAVDFDGVIHSYEMGWFDGAIYGELVDGAAAALRVLMTRFSVYVFTSRNEIATANWIKEKTGIHCVTGIAGDVWDIQGLLLVSNRKLPAIAYIDDCAIKFTDWDSAMIEIGRLHL